MSSPKLKLYVDVVSPFGYIAYWVLRNDPVFSKCDITYVPMFLGGVMKACGNTPPINIKNKDKWINKDRERLAKAFKVPIAATMPEGFPPLTLTSMRALCALTVVIPGSEAEKQRVLVRVLDEVLREFWVEHRKVNEKGEIEGILEGIVGKDVTGKVMEMLGKEGKELLAKNTDEALADGAFGLPWFVATNEKGVTETFWGVDHLAQVATHLGLERPEMGGWKSLL